MRVEAGRSVRGEGEKRRRIREDMGGMGTGLLLLLGDEGDRGGGGEGQGREGEGREVREVEEMLEEGMRKLKEELGEEWER